MKVSDDHEKAEFKQYIIFGFSFSADVFYGFVVFGLPPAVTRLVTERMVTNSSAAEGCIPTCGKQTKKPPW